MSRKTTIKIIPGKEKKALKDVLAHDFEKFHKADGSKGGFDSKASRYPINMPHPIKNVKPYSASATNRLKDKRSQEERDTKRENIAELVDKIDAWNLSKAVARLARSGPSASDLKKIIEAKGIQNIDFDALVKVPYIETYYDLVSDGYTSEGYPLHRTEIRYELETRHYSIMEIAAKEYNTVFIDTIMSELLKAAYEESISQNDINKIENSMLDFFNHSTGHRHVIGNTLYGAIQRVKQDYANDPTFDEQHFNNISKNITRSLCGKLYEHVSQNRLRQPTAWILSFTLCLLLPIVGHAIVWGIYFYQKAKMDFKNTTISFDKYLAYLNRKEGRDFTTYEEVQEHLNNKAAAKPTKMNKHECSSGSRICNKPSHQFKIPKQVEFDGEQVHIRTTRWNGQTAKFRRALKGLEENVENNEYHSSTSAKEPSAPHYSLFFNDPRPPQNPDYVQGAHGLLYDNTQFAEGGVYN